MDDELAQYAKLAIESAAADLGTSPLDLARRLNQGEIARLIRLLNATLRHVQHSGLHHRVEDLLMAVTDGRMPAERPETELDWALKVSARRRQRQAPDEEE